MKKTLVRLGISLPWTAGAALLAVFCVQAYLDGRNFVQGMHGLRWLMNMVLVLWVFLPALAIAIGVTIGHRRHLKESRRLGVAILVVGASMVIPFFALSAMSRSFLAGRDAAYRSVNYQAVYDACKELELAVPQPAGRLLFGKGERAYDHLPTAIRQLSPLFVHATPHAVAIQMDGGGPMYHEGIGVVLACKSENYDKVCDYSLRHLDWCRRLDSSLPVLLYRLYDYRIFLNEANEAAEGEQRDSSDKR